MASAGKIEKTTFFRLVKRLGIVPAFIDLLPNKQLSFYFSEEQVKEIARFARLPLGEKRRLFRKSRGLDRLTRADFRDGERTAKILRSFDEGLCPEEVVFRFQIAPTVVERHHEVWLGSKGGIVLTGPQIRTIGLFPWGGPWLEGVKDGDGFVEGLRKFFLHQALLQRTPGT